MLLLNEIPKRTLILKTIIRYGLQYIKNWLLKWRRHCFSLSIQQNVKCLKIKISGFHSPLNTFTDDFLFFLFWFNKFAVLIKYISIYWLFRKITDRWRKILTANQLSNNKLVLSRSTMTVLWLVYYISEVKYQNK